jgi:hypothetical protein
MLGLGSLVIFNAAISAEDLSGNSTEPTLTITVRVLDYGQVPQWILANAEKEAASILRAAGIESVWLDCPTRPVAKQSDSACARPFSPADPVLRILSESMAGRMHFHDNTMGYAALEEKGGRGYGFVAGIFYAKVESVAEETRTLRCHVLSHAMAHEIGHLLLGTLKHSNTGLMGACWRPEEMRLARRGELQFSAREATLLRAEVRARASAESFLEEGRRPN